MAAQDLSQKAKELLASIKTTVGQFNSLSVDFLSTPNKLIEEYRDKLCLVMQDEDNQTADKMMMQINLLKTMQETLTTIYTESEKTALIEQDALQIRDSAQRLEIDIVDYRITLWALVAKNI